MKIATWNIERLQKRKNKEIVQSIKQFNADTSKGGKFFLEYMKDVNVQKRRYGEFVLYEDGLYVKFEPTIQFATKDKKVLTSEYKTLDALYNPKPIKKKKE